MKRDPQDTRHLIRLYEQKLSEASVPLWMDAPDILSVLDYYEQQGLYFESEQCMRWALRLHPDNPEVIVRRAYRLKNEGRWTEALEWVKRVPNQEGVEVKFFEAEHALSQLQFDLAETCFLTGLHHEQGESSIGEGSDGLFHPEMSDLLLEIGELFMDYGSPDQALKYLAFVHVTSPAYPRSQTLWAECEFQKGQSTEAMSRLNSLLDEDPYHLDAWLLMADISHETKNYEKCHEAAQFALAINPKNEKALRLKAVAALSLERLDEVLDIYNVYRKLFPTDYTMALSAGEILMHQNRILEAREVLTRSNQACPNEHPEKQRILSDIALTYVAEHNFPQAYHTLLGCTSLGLSHGEVLLLMAQFCLSQKAIQEGIQSLSDYIELYSLDADSRLRIARMLAENNVFGEARQLWEKLFKISEPGSTLAAPYLALAARRLLLIRDFFFWIAYASYEDPTQTKQIFQEIYPNVLPSDYLQHAKEEFPFYDF